MKGKKKYRFSLKTFLLHSVAIFLSFIFIKDTIQASLLWLNDGSQSYELLEMTVEEAAEDTESEEKEKEKEKGTEEFIISGKTVFVPMSGSNYFSSFTYNRTFKNRVSEMLTPPPRLRNG